jgi:hypothetical protein
MAVQQRKANLLEAQGAAPGATLAAKFNADDASKGMAMQRPLCPYPHEAK